MRIKYNNNDVHDNIIHQTPLLPGIKYGYRRVV